MKKAILTFPLLFIFLNIFGQGLITHNSQWYFDYNQGFVPDPVTVFVKMQFVQDTVIEDSSIHVMQTTYYDVTNNQIIGSHANNFLHIDGNKVYRYISSEFKLLYDLDAQVGDILTTYSQNCNMEGQSVVTETGAVMLNGESLKFIKIETMENSEVFYSGYIYERFGPINNGGFFPTDQCFTDGFSFGSLRCYNDIEMSYQRDNLVGDCSMGFVGIADIFSSESIKVFPNPSPGAFTIDINAVGINNLSVYNVLGEIILTDKRKLFGAYPLDLTESQNGLYFIELTSKTGDRKTIKLIKE